MSARRIFWGRSLAQAVAKAARHYRVAPEDLAWRRHEKRHGFVKHPRAVLVEVDPEALLRPASAGGARAAETVSAARPSPPTEGARAPSRAAKIVAQRNETPFDAPDDESEQAALEAIRRLLRFAGIDVEANIARRDERLEIALEPSGSTTEGAIGLELLDELEHLLPKAILTLSGRRVRATVDFAGQREARADELRALAQACAERVRASGQSETLGPLSPGERRTVHLFLESDPDVTTESVGDDYRKQLRINPLRGN